LISDLEDLKENTTTIGDSFIEWDLFANPTKYKETRSSLGGSVELCDNTF
jgi:hypothetical protein